MKKDRKLIRLVLLEPYCVLREGLSSILQRSHGICIVGEFASLSTFLPWYKSQKVDVILVGYHLHNVASMSWLQFCGRQAKVPGILVMNGLNHPRHMRAVLEQGARGVIDLRTSGPDIEKAVRSVAAGHRFVAPAEARHATEALNSLSAREFDVLMLTAMGFRLKEIADRLGVATQTAYSYRTRVREKLLLKTPSDIVRYACDHGLLACGTLPRREAPERRARAPAK